jgi:tetratricopeptide (TPR) repeat protein
VLLAGLATSMSSAAIGVAGALGLVAVWRRGFRGVAVAVGVGGGLVALLAAGAETSATARVQVWGAALRAWAQSPLFGVGLGGFSVAVEPFRTDRLPVVWGHAHADLLEWAVETGLVGLVGGAVAVGLVRPRPLRSGECPWAIDLGIAAVLLHSLVDFPLHVPLIAGLVGAVWGVRRAIYEVRRPIGARGVRATLVGLGLVLGLAAASSYRTAVCEGALATIAAGDLRAASTLTSWRWQGPEAEMAKGVAGALTDGEVAAMAVRWPHRADVWRSIAVSHARGGQPEAALADLAQAERVGPADWRTFVARGRLLAAMGEGPGAAAAYVGAFERGAPWDLVAAGYAAFPVAVWWVDALDALPPHYAWALARAAMAGEPDSALLALDVAERDRPRFYTPTRIEVLLTARRFAAAEAAARGWLDGHPTDADTWVALAQAQGGLGRPADELASLTAASSLNPGYRPRLIAGLGRAGRVEEARTALRSWALTGDVAPETYLAYGEVLASIGDFVGCRQVLDQMRPAPLGAGFVALRGRCAATQ